MGADMGVSKHIAGHTDLVEPALLREDGDMPVITSASYIQRTNRQRSVWSTNEPLPVDRHVPLDMMTKARNGGLSASACEKG